jgi:hypothetical protein
LGQLRRQGGGDSDKIEVPRSVMDGHLFALAPIGGVRVTLVHELVQGEASVHQHTFKCDVTSI